MEIISLTTLELGAAGGVGADILYEDEMVGALWLRGTVVWPADLPGDGTAAGVVSDQLLSLLEVGRALADLGTRDTGADECGTVVWSGESLHLLEWSTLGSDWGQAGTSVRDTDLLGTAPLLSRVVDSLNSLADLTGQRLAGRCGADHLSVF